jgi:hypothetical protein
MYSFSSHDLIDDALELAASLKAGPPAPAVFGGWSAIESLLSHPADTARASPAASSPLTGWLRSSPARGRGPS